MELKFIDQGIDATVFWKQNCLSPSEFVLCVGVCVGVCVNQMALKRLLCCFHLFGVVKLWEQLYLINAMWVFNVAEFK